MKSRKVSVKRRTKETDISVRLNIDGSGKYTIRSGIPFFDHMLELFAKNAVIDLELDCKGDIEVDYHHTVEDCGLVLGEAFNAALGEKRGINRYGTGFDPQNPLFAESYVPMDETLARCVVDFSGRPYLVWRGMDRLEYKRISAKEKSQDMACAFRFGLAKEFFRAFATRARCNLHIELLYGGEPHHVVEALFKAFGRAVGYACRIDPRMAGKIPSTKGKL
ncbi:MAG: imidazoleglycerol-phosphate dehydratase HisB [Verrucomicrobiia bacterium]|jgi:imidazoleglycerol-phosphate dehydratase